MPRQTASDFKSFRTLPMKDAMKRKVPDQEANLAALEEIKQNYFNIKRQTEAEEAREKNIPKEMNI